MRTLIPPLVCSSCSSEMASEGHCVDTIAYRDHLDRGAVIQLTKTIGAGYAHQQTYHYTIVEVSDLFGCNFDGTFAPEIYLITETDGSDRMMYAHEVTEWLWLKLRAGFDIEVDYE